MKGVKKYARQTLSNTAQKCVDNTLNRTDTVNCSSNASEPHGHPCPPPLQAVAVPAQVQQLKGDPMHFHRPLHDSHKGYVEHTMSAP